MYDLDYIFHLHHLEPGDSLKLVKIRDAAMAFAQVVVENTPECPDQDAAVRKIREAVWTANAAVAIGKRAQP